MEEHELSFVFSFKLRLDTILRQDDKLVAKVVLDNESRVLKAGFERGILCCFSLLFRGSRFCSLELQWELSTIDSNILAISLKDGRLLGVTAQQLLMSARSFKCFIKDNLGRAPPWITLERNASILRKLAYGCLSVHIWWSIIPKE